MKGWTPDGREVILNGWQERAVRGWAAWDAEHTWHLPMMGRGGGKSVLIATIARYDKNRGLLEQELRQ